jgi:DNA-binding MarR family transcriptional regulator
MAGPPEGQERLTGRNGDVWRAYCAGETQESIAQRFGIAQPRVSQIVTTVRASIPAEDTDARRQRYVELLDRQLAMVAELVESEPIPAYSNGKPVLDKDGNVALDHTGRINALKAGLAVTERVAKLLGLDAPARTDVNLVTAAREATSAAAAAAAARMAEAAGD